MKRLLRHIVFWIVYLVQDVVLIFFVDATRVPQLAENVRIRLAVESCLVCLLPKLIFTYFMLYVVLKRIASESIKPAYSLLYTLLMLSGCLLLYRALVVYFTNPVIYGWPSASLSYFDPLGFLVALMDIGFASGAAIVIKQIRLQVAAKEWEKNLLREKLETELKFLRNQVNPHFLFNTLNNIYALARKQSVETPEAVMKLSKLLRFMLYESKNESIKISDEIKMLDDYIELQKIRYTDRLAVVFTKEIDNEAEQVSPLLLIPFVENAFKHGAGESRFQSSIHLDIQLQNKILTFHIENTKEPDDKATAAGNIGLANVQRQLELMYRDYNLAVQNEKTRFAVSLRINLDSYAKI